MRPSSASEAHRLKTAGFACLAAGALVLVLLGAATSDSQWFMAGRVRDIALVAALWLIGAHLVAAGLVVLVAGLQGVAILTSARARTGAWTKVAGASLLIQCFAFVTLEESPVFAPLFEVWWIAWPALALFLLAARSGVVLLRRGWKYEAVAADELLAADPRPPVVYLRSFVEDDRIVIRSAGFLGQLTRIFDYMSAISPEQELAMILSRVGPVVAIGKPGETLPELGAARLYVSNEEWKAKIQGLMEHARLVIIRAAATPNLWWEIEQAMAIVPHRKVLIVSLGAASQTEAFDRRFEQTFGATSRPHDETHRAPWLTWLYPLHHLMGRIIYFDEGLKPREEPVRLTLSWMGLLMGAVRPYRDSIQSAMQRVLRALGLSYDVGKNQTAAVLLALFGGIIGLHHFYLGDARRGVRYLSFFWIGVPALLGWRDAVRFARLDAVEFGRRYLGHPMDDRAGPVEIEFRNPQSTI